MFPHTVFALQVGQLSEATQNLWTKIGLRDPATLASLARDPNFNLKGLAETEADWAQLQSMLPESETVSRLRRAQWANMEPEERAALAKPSATSSRAKSATVVYEPPQYQRPRPLTG